MYATLPVSTCTLENDLNNNVSPRPVTDQFLLCDELAQACIPRSNLHLELGYSLGYGGFGSVYRGSFASRTVAVKVLDRQRGNNAAQNESYQAELRVLSLNHPNIVRTLAATAPESCDQTGPAMVIMEFVAGRNLLDLLSSLEENLTPKRRVKFALQIASAMEFAHRNGIVHLDVKPANVMITSDDDCKLCDFGCCQPLESTATGKVSPTVRSALTGTVAYRAPEVLRGGAATDKADIYSLGITLWQMLSRQIPYASEKHPHVVVFAVVAQNLRPALIKTSDDTFELWYANMYTECWSARPADRPSTSDLIRALQLWRHQL